MGTLGGAAGESRSLVRRDSWLREFKAGVGAAGRAVISIGPGADIAGADGGPGGPGATIPESVSIGSSFPSDLRGPAAHDRRFFANLVNDDSRFFGLVVSVSEIGATCDTGRGGDRVRMGGCMIL